MRKIGFKNFRKFENFPNIDLAPITIFVGENNAGKSTVVKGILALSDYITRQNERFRYIIRDKNEKTPTENNSTLVEKIKNLKFYFNTSYLTHIGTFKRALFNEAKNNIITFSTCLGEQYISIDVIGDNNDEETAYGIISKISIEYISMGIYSLFDLQNNTATIEFKSTEVSSGQLSFISGKKRTVVQSFLKSIPKKYRLEYNITQYLKYYGLDLIDTLESTIEIAISATMEFDKTKNYIGSELVNKLKPIDNVNEETVTFLKKYTLTVFDNPKGEEWIFRFPKTQYLQGIISIEYLYAHAVTQTVIYSAKDTNDYLSRTIDEFASLPKSDGDYKRTFIKYWMKEFGIGKDYKITSVGGEAHLVKIINNNDKSVNLADMGMGSIQLMVLLFRLAITLPKKSKSANNLNSRLHYSHIIIIEEPEQNLHPMFQSKIADLFFELNTKYDFRFIIETHSEYLIRRSQVIVGNNYTTQEKLDNHNPFKVYYFPSDGIPYDMVYSTTGLFERKFGDGFINEAGKLHMAVLKNAKKQE
ncbi:MAG: AAA family ATPase [Bacteroidales bacterium]|nr:AAA family ATPase [Bacteroidales bacterium]